MREQCSEMSSLIFSKYIYKMTVSYPLLFPETLNVDTCSSRWNMNMPFFYITFKSNCLTDVPCSLSPFILIQCFLTPCLVCLCKFPLNSAKLASLGTCGGVWWLYIEPLFEIWLMVLFQFSLSFSIFIETYCEF